MTTTTNVVAVFIAEGKPQSVAAEAYTGAEDGLAAGVRGAVADESLLGQKGGQKGFFHGGLVGCKEGKSRVALQRSLHDEYVADSPVVECGGLHGGIVDGRAGEQTARNVGFVAVEGQEPVAQFVVPSM